MTAARFSARRLGRLAGVSTPVLRRLVKLGVLRPVRGDRGEAGYGFADVALARRFAALGRRGRSFGALVAYRNGARLRMEEGRVLASDDGGSWEPDTGQGVLSFSMPRSADVATIPTARDDARRESMVLLVQAAEFEATVPERAEALYLRVIDKEDDNEVEARVNLGRLYHELGRSGDALAMFRRATRREPGCAIAWYNLGVVLHDCGSVDGALAAYMKALDVDATLADAHFNASRLHEQRGDTLSALRHLRCYRQLTSD